MSGDVQPRKRKDKRKKKDDLGVEEPRGTAAALGDGDVFMHSYSDHGTGGHWCAKIIFFSLLAILVTLIGLIILENRGLSELEANSVESRYSGVLEGWLEDVPDDDHHDAHTLELNHPKSQNDHDNHNGGHDEEDDGEDSDEVQGDENYEHNNHIDDEVEQESHEDSNNDDDDDDEREDNNLNEEQNEEKSFGYASYFGWGRESKVPDIENDDDGDNEDESNAETSRENEPVDKRRYAYRNQDSPKDDTVNSREDDDDKAMNEYKKYNNNDQENEDNEFDDDFEPVDDANAETDDVDEDDHRDDDDSVLQDSGEEDIERTISDEKQDDDDDVNNSERNYEDDDDESLEDNREHEDEEHDDHEDHEEDEEPEEVEKLEEEFPDEEPISTELPALPEDNDDEDDKQLEESVEEDEIDNEPNDADDDDEFLSPDDEDLPIIEHITAPAGKPYVEVDEDDTSTELSPDTLKDEEEYERQQEELRREEEEAAAASQMWLKLIVGGALLAATHAVMRRGADTRDTPERDEEDSREGTPSTPDRRMTLIPQERSEPVITKKATQESSKPLPKQEDSKKIPLVIKSAPTPKQISEEDEEEIVKASEKDKELYSDDENPDDEEEIEDVKPSTENVVEKEASPQAESEDDVEIIDEEQIDEEIEEEEEDISDVDDVELLNRLEAKYGRLPEPHRPHEKPSNKDGGNSIGDAWPGEPSEAYWRQQLDDSEEDVQQGKWMAAYDRVSAPELQASGRARYIAATALDKAAEARRDNSLLSRAIAAYLHLLKMNENLSDEKLLQIANRTLDRIMFRGNYLSAEPVYKLLIRRFPNEINYRNKLSISYLMANRADLAEGQLKETLKKWPNDRVALAHYGFVLKTEHNRVEESIDYFQRALEGDTGPANEPRFYYHLGDAFLLLGRFPEAHEVHKRGTALGHFLSPAQRSLYNVKRLKSRPWWNIEQTPYARLARTLERSWKEILKEGMAAKALYEQEKEGLKERGEWSQLDLFARGREIPGRCQRAPVTCSIIKSEGADGCSRGQIKFSSMEAGTHVRPHVGPTNCRLRMHLGLSNTDNTYIRVDQETRQWKLGKVFMFDDSFEHEVWHNGTGTRLVLIVDVWHPALTPLERRQLPAI